MHERVAQLNGKVRIETAPGEGTRVRVELPARPAPNTHEDVIAEAADG
jgi:nitrate/nitrite-specific signal transduction histidine kinase